MNYRHIYHAGNFADVFKHLVLTFLLQSFHKKETPFCYLETHAGTAVYDLQHEAAQKTGEHRQGILKLWRASSVPPAWQPYVDAVRALNKGGQLRYYPGSPKIARGWLRSQDRLVLAEKEPHEFERLYKEFARDKQVSVRAQDGYAVLKAELPPKERRGLVLIDPPYESPTETEMLIKCLRDSYQRWAGGVYALWYPIKDERSKSVFLNRVAGLGIRKILNAEFCLNPTDNALRLNGAGMVIVNPPWQLDSLLKDELPRLLEVLREANKGKVEVSWLVPE
jgi:23S rRNA (adenine2030-N6)-methyltransferase